MGQFIKSHLVALVHIPLIRFFIQFKTGCHRLLIVLDQCTGVPRGQRVCSACECSALSNIRSRYAHLFSEGGVTMKQFIWQEGIVDVMLFVRECFTVLVPSETQQ